MTPRPNKGWIKVIFFLIYDKWPQKMVRLHLILKKSKMIYEPSCLSSKNVICGWLGNDSAQFSGKLNRYRKTLSKLKLLNPNWILQVFRRLSLALEAFDPFFPFEDTNQLCHLVWHESRLNKIGFIPVVFLLRYREGFGFRNSLRKIDSSS